MPLNASSSISVSLMALPIPGIIPIKSLTLPIFLICWICLRKSLKLNWFLAIFFCSFLASSSSNCSWAFSTNETISPMPKILSAIRDGWNRSSASIFSPIPTNLIGLFTTDFMVRAAPPLVSPSNFVNTTCPKSQQQCSNCWYCRTPCCWWGNDEWDHLN